MATKTKTTWDEAMEALESLTPRYSLSVERYLRWTVKIHDRGPPDGGRRS